MCMVKRRRGQVLILMVPALLVLIGMGIFAVDVGHMFVANARAQNASDAAVMAACHVLTTRRSYGAGEEEARKAAAREGMALARANFRGTAVDIQFGRFYGDRFYQTNGEGGAATAVRAVVARNEKAPDGPVSLFFGPVLGLRSADLATSAVSAVGANVMGLRGNLAPFAIHEDDVRPPGSSMTIYDQKKMAPGAFGLLNLNGGPFKTPEVWKWIRDGYDGDVSLDPESGHLWVDGGTGFRSAIKKALNEKLGEELTVCVYDKVRGRGHNTDFRIVSFARVTLTDVRLTGKKKYVKGRVEKMGITDGVILGPVGNSPNMCAVRLCQ